LSYMIVRFKVFNIKLLGSQVLVFFLGFLVLAIAFIRNIENVRVVVIITLLFVIVLGSRLINSVKKEVQQKEELAELNVDLQNLIQQKESLMHLINHKVKGAFTHSKYIFSEILAGSFGPLSPGLEKMAKMGIDSDQVGVETIDLILNASNLQKGIVQYEMKPTDFRNIVTDSILKKSGEAEQKGLKLEGDISNDECMVSGDVFWLKEVVNNLIENSIKYTSKGDIDIVLKNENNKVLFFVKDNGVGVTEEDKKNLFTEGGRGKDSVKINVDSTGYGLYTVKLIVEAHGGRVWVESDGKDKGSTFLVELDAI